MMDPSATQPRRRGKYAERPRTDPDAALVDDGWREQDVIVMGRRFKLGDVNGGRLFHGTRAVLAEGDVLEPGHGTNFEESSVETVSITSSAETAAYWAAQAGGAVHVYEVEPIGGVEIWRAGLANRGSNFELFEGRVHSARVLTPI